MPDPFRGLFDASVLELSNEKELQQQITSVVNQLAAMDATAEAALAQALVEFAEYLLALIQHNIHSKSGRLAQSGHVLPPEIIDGFVTVTIQWDAPYARIQDVGGVVTPSDFRATPTAAGGYRSIKSGKFISKRRVFEARLFVPLREGVVPIKDPNARAASGYKYGVDYVLSRYVVIKGSRYMSNVLDREMPNADRTIGQMMEAIWSGMSGLDREFRASNAGPMDARPQLDRPAVDSTFVDFGGGNE